MLFTIPSQDLEYQPIDHAENFVGVGVQDHAEDNKPVKEHQENISKILVLRIVIYSV